MKPRVTAPGPPVTPIRWMLRFPLLSTPTNVVTGYYAEDVNLDGFVKYVGENNDRDPILQLIGGSTPTNVVVGQAP